MDILATIEDYFNRGELHQAINYINNEIPKTDDKELTLTLNYQKARALTSLNQFDEASAILSTISEDNEGGRYGVKAKYLLATIAAQKNDFTRSNSMLKSLIMELGTKELDRSEELRVRGDSYNRLGTNFISTGSYDDAIEYLQKSLSAWEELGDKSKIGVNLYNLGTTFFQKGHLDEAKEYLLRTEDIFSEIDNMTGVAYCKMEIGGILQYQGHLKNALDNFLKAYALYQDYGTSTQVAWSLTDLANIYQRMGEISKSLNYFQQAIPLYEKTSDKRVFGNHLLSMGISHRMQGEYERAIDLSKQALDLYREVENDNYAGRAMLQLGKIYFEKEAISTSLEYLQEAETIFKEVNNLDFLGRTYFQLIITGSDKLSPEKLKNYLEELRTIRERSSSTIQDQMYRLAQAKLAIIDDRITRLSSGIKELEDLLDNSIVDIEMITHAHLMLLDALIIELSYTKSETVLNEIKHRIDAALKSAKKQDAPNLTVKLNLIKAKIKIYEVDLQSAQKLLSEAIDLAKSKGYNALKSLADKLKGDLDDRRTEIEKLLTGDKNVDQLLEISGLNNFIGNLLYNHLENLSHDLDNPVYFTILVEGGISIYSNYFRQFAVNDQLLGGFITALSSFSQETFQGEALLDQINIGNYRLRIWKIGSLTTCYVYEGSTIAAMHKLENFSALIDEFKIEEMVYEANKNHEEIDDEKFDEQVERIFNPV